MHGRLDLPDLQKIYRMFPDEPPGPISDAQRTPLPSLAGGTIHHGLPPSLLSFHPEPGRYLAFLGRISPEKRPDRAIEIAKRVGMPLKIAAKVDKVDEEYFASVIEPMMDDPLIEFVGEIDERPEGPVPGRGRGAAVSDRLARAVRPGDDRGDGLRYAGRRLRARLGARGHARRRVGVRGRDRRRGGGGRGEGAGAPRQGCRACFEDRFTAPRMAADYVRLYEKAIHRQRPHLVTDDETPEVIPESAVG